MNKFYVTVGQQPNLGRRQSLPITLSRTPEPVSALCSQQTIGVGSSSARHHTLPHNTDSFQAQRLSLLKQCTYYQHSAHLSVRDQISPSIQQQQQMQMQQQLQLQHQQCAYTDSRDQQQSYVRRLDYSPARHDYERFTIPEERDLDIESTRRGNDRSRSCDRYPRAMSPVSRFTNTPSPLPRSLSRGSSQSCQSSSADESGREGGGGASSSGIGLSGSSADSSRRASCCSSGTGSSRLTFHSNAVTLVGSNLSRDSINSRIQAGTPELTVTDVTHRSSERADYYDDDDNIRQHQGTSEPNSSIKSDCSAPQRAQSMDSLENELTCPICLDLFHEPVLLPCAHNLCFACVDQFFATHGSAGPTESPGSRAVFHCPTCREIVALDDRGITALRRNLTLQNIVDGYRRAAVSSVPHVVGAGSEFGDSSGEESSASNLSTQSDGSLGPSRSHRRSRPGIDPQGQDRGNATAEKDYVHLSNTTSSPPIHHQLHEEEAVFCQFCDMEPPRVAVKTCLTCRAYYCERCLRVTHPRKKPFINHKLVPATPGSAGTLSAPSSNKMVATRRSHPSCYNHSQETADLYCVNCDLTLCKICSLDPEHGSHDVQNIADWCQQAKVDLENQAATMKKCKDEVERNLGKFVEACREIEDNASAQEAKLVAECESLMRIVQERKEAIASKIKETKANRIRKFTQSLQAGKQCLENMESAINGAVETSRMDQNTGLFLKNAKATSERINQARNSANEVSAQAVQLSPPGFFLDFAQEKALLEKLDILEAPATPRICEELCTQSHDKVTVQWRSSDHRHTESYELQYAIDDKWSTHESPPDGWMIVPNIKDCNYTIHGMQTGTRYVFAVKARNKAGATRSELVSIKTLGMPFSFDTHNIHKKLRLASHGYTVSRDDSGKKGKDNGSSSSLCGVTGNVVIEGGRHYWEVVVCQSTSFTLGVAYTNAPRFEWTGRNNLSWCLCRSNQDWSVRHDGKDIPVQIPFPYPKKIGVLLDFDSGVLSFFDGASGCRLHAFRAGAFKLPLKPAFSVGNKSLTINTGITVPDHLNIASD